MLNKNRPTLSRYAASTGLLLVAVVHLVPMDARAQRTPEFLTRPFLLAHQELDPEQETLWLAVSGIGIDRVAVEVFDMEANAATDKLPAKEAGLFDGYEAIRSLLQVFEVRLESVRVKAPLSLRIQAFDAGGRPAPILQVVTSLRTDSFRSKAQSGSLVTDQLLVFPDFFYMNRADRVVANLYCDEPVCARMSIQDEKGKTVLTTPWVSRGKRPTALIWSDHAKHPPGEFYVEVKVVYAARVGNDCTKLGDKDISDKVFYGRFYMIQ